MTSISQADGSEEDDSDDDDGSRGSSLDRIKKRMGSMGECICAEHRG